MLRRNIAITGFALTALSLAALVIVEIHFAGIARGTSLFLLFFSLTTLAVASALVAAMRQNKHQTNAPCIHSENSEKLSLAYHELLARYQGLMEITPSAIIEIDASGNIVSLNNPARKLTGRPEDNRTQESPFAQFLPGQNRAELDKLFGDIRQGNAISGRQLPLVQEDGGVNRLDVNSAPLWSDGMITGYLISIHDAGKAERLMMELEDARRITEETTEQLKKTILDIEEFTLLAVKREVKMQEIRERLKRFKEGRNEDIVH